MKGAVTKAAVPARCYALADGVVEVDGVRWPIADFLAGRAVGLLLPATRRRALGELVVVVLLLEALEQDPAAAQEQAA